MSIQLIAILASAGLLSAGVAGTAQTRSSAAIPVASMVSVSKARVAPGLSIARQGGTTDCTLMKTSRFRHAPMAAPAPAPAPLAARATYSVWLAPGFSVRAFTLS